VGVGPPTPARLARYVREDELHQAFNFHFLNARWDAGALREVITESLATADSVGAPSTWVLSNHDVKRHVTRFGSSERARAAALLMLALPGSAYVYNGEELGLPEVLDLPAEVCLDPQRLRDPDSGRDGCRVPMPWTSSDGYGWRRPWLPVPGDWGGLSVEAQAGDPGSMLSLYKQALRLRRTVSGELRWHDSPAGTLVFSRDDGFVCTVNLTGDPVDYPVDGRAVLSSAPVEEGRLAPDSTTWWRAKVA
ncbi:alpha-amylase family glycosyl hydrolase, partial [Nonomuraea sp. bgisy101]|uniref:alpha-amylase family glycosyl hydrolase n=1 Tax=Nonomuraea sp. bgisy101 TaxID=3413784 RepID=UPI003D763F87